MNYQISATIPVDFFEDIESAPTDGTPIFAMNEQGQIDIAAFDRGEWTSEFGLGDNYVLWAKISVLKG